MRIWVTGIGVVSPVATGARATMDRLCRAERAFGPVSLFDVDGQRARIAAEVRGLSVEDVAPRAKDDAPWSRTDALALVAAKEALAEARVDPAKAVTDLVVGTTTGATLETERALPDLLSDASADRLTPAITHPLALVLEHVATALGPFRTQRLVSSACSTGANAIALGAAWLRSGRSDRVLAGASDALCRLTFTGFNALGSLDPEPCRPFDATRAGLGLGEGAAFLLLERDDVAKARGAEPIAELVGWAAGAEAHHITNPEASGRVAARTMRRALACAGLGPQDVDYVNAHGTATALNDPMEVRAMRLALGDAFDRVAVSSVKGQIGHSLGAAGAVEAAVTALAVAQGRLPPTGGLDTVADDCRADHVVGSARERRARVALSSSFGFGGLDGVLALARPEYGPDLEVSSRKVYVLGGAVIGRQGARTTRDAELLREPGEAPRGALDMASVAVLDPARSRRLGRPERLLAAAIDGARGSSAAQAGIVAGKPSGNPDATSRFMARILERGPRFASPADFPNLMLSSLAGHVSIYHHLEGLALSTSSRSGSGAACLRTALELVGSGMPDPLFTGAVDPWGMAAEVDGADRAELATALLLAAEPDGDRAVRIRWNDAAEALPPPGSRSRVLVTGDADDDLPDDWRDVPRLRAEDWFGRSDASALAAVVLAVGFALNGDHDPVVVLVVEQDRTATVVVESP